MLEIFYFVLGFILLLVGAKYLVSAATQIAEHFAISPLVIGLTIVALGTNSPEFFVSIQSALLGHGGIALGNVVGSNTFNILGVLGIAGLVRPLLLSNHLIRFDIPILLLVSAGFFLLASFGNITPFHGIVLLLCAIAYIVGTIRHSRKLPTETHKEYEKEFGSRKKSVQALLLQTTLLIGGLVAVTFGARFFVMGATYIAKLFNVSDVIIGLTLVAVGSSLPELATSLYATWKKEYDIAIGNMIGSNIFNILGVLGIATFFQKGGIPMTPGFLHVDIPLMLIATCLIVPLSRKIHTIGRLKAGILVSLYILYVLYLIGTAMGIISDPTSPLLILLSLLLTFYTALRLAQIRRRQEKEKSTVQKK